MNIWKDISGYEGLYQVSNTGIVRNIRSDKKGILKGSDNGHGYLQFSLYKTGKIKTYKAHRLVANAFIPNTDNKQDVNHKDGNKYNNKVENLEWVTKSENLKHAWDMGLKCVSQKQISALRSISSKKVLDTSTGTIYSSAKDAADSIGTHYGTLMNKLCGHRTNNTSLIYI